jgi:hypothetical protein
MLDGATKSFIHVYYGQAVVDCESRVIVAADVTQQANDRQQLVPMMDQIHENLGEIPDSSLVDAGCFMEERHFLAFYVRVRFFQKGKPMVVITPQISREHACQHARLKSKLIMGH